MPCLSENLMLDIYLPLSKEPGECRIKTIMVGDSETDVGAARNANIPVIAVDFGYTALTPEELKADIITIPF